jgi:hypothetical protein
MAIRYGRKDCDHILRASNGYEEYCSAAICIKCGAMGCFCDAKRTGVSKEVFFKEKYEIDANINGKWENPYVEAKKKDAVKGLIKRVNDSFSVKI